MSTVNSHRYDLRIEGADEKTNEQFNNTLQNTRLADYIAQDPDDPFLYTSEVLDYDYAGYYFERVEEALHYLSTQFPHLKMHFIAEDLEERGKGYEIKMQGDMYQYAERYSSLSEFCPPVPFDRRAFARVIERERGTDVDRKIDQLCKNTDYDLLDAQKNALLAAIQTGATPPKEAMEGLVHLLDEMCDLGEALGRFKYNDIDPKYPMQPDYTKCDVAFAPEEKSTKELAMSLYEQMRETHNADNAAYYIAKNLAYLANNAEPDEEVPLDVLYQISERLYNVGGDQPLLNEERLDALKKLLEEGIVITVDNDIECEDVTIRPADIPAFLLSCDMDAFIYAVEITAYDNQELNCDERSAQTHMDLMNNLLKELGAFNRGKDPVSLADKISEAEHRVQPVPDGKSIEKEKDI